MRQTPARPLHIVEQEQTHRREALQSLLRHPGWKILEERLESDIALVEKRILHGQLTPDDYLRRTVERKCLREALHLPRKMIGQAKESPDE